MYIWCKFVDYSSKLLQVTTETSQISKNSKSKWPKWPWRSGAMTFMFDINRECPRVYVWCKFGAQIYDKLLRRQAEFCRMLSQNGQNVTEGQSQCVDIAVRLFSDCKTKICLNQGQWPPFSIPTENITGCMFAKSMTSYRADKPNFLEFQVKMAKMTLKVKFNVLHFQFQTKVSQYVCLVQIWWF